MTVESFDRIKISDFDKSMGPEIVNRPYKFKAKRIEFPTTETPRLGGETL